LQIKNKKTQNARLCGNRYQKDRNEEEDKEEEN
jgi:hypothetical protein